MATRLILHHYDFSNFAEKARLMLGRKGLPWESVEIPSTHPKPDYTPLTGGYRRTPSLQVGADIYCDTRRIADFLEEQAPQPTFYPGDARYARAFTDILSPWAEAHLLWPLALYVTGTNADRFPASFHRDRAILHGKPPPSLAQVRRAAERNLAQLRPQLAWVEGLLSGDALFLLGDEPGLADFVVYHPFFLLRVLGGPSALLDPYPRLRAWCERVAAVGQGSPTPLSSADAIACARAAEPARVEGEDMESGWVSGTPVRVLPRDDRSAPSTGTLVALSEREICIHHEHEAVGRVAVHFPRVGYDLRRLESE